MADGDGARRGSNYENAPSRIRKPLGRHEIRPRRSFFWTPSLKNEYEASNTCAKGRCERNPTTCRSHVSDESTAGGREFRPLRPRSSVLAKREKGFVMFGDPPFFGGSIFETPPQPQVYSPPPAPQPAPAPAPDYGGQYTYGANHSGFRNSGGSLTGYDAEPNGSLGYYDHGHRV